MTDRLNKIFLELGNCKTFADIGCDHGYIAKAMLDSGKAERVIVSDISAKCLEKAESLLFEEIKQGRAKSVVSDGFKNVGECDLALIAGMGGEEIVDIISSVPFLPKSLVLQPMKNADKVRLCAVSVGYKLVKDYVFKSAKKFYEIIVLEKGKDLLNDEEIEFGRTNIKERPNDFIEFLQLKITQLSKVLESGGLNEQSKADMQKRLEKLKKYVKI